MRTQQRLASLAIVLILAAGAAVAGAQPGPERGPRGDRWERMADRLNLTEAQKQSIGAIREEHRTQQMEGRKQIVQLEAQLRTLMLADAPDEAAALKLVDQLGALRARQEAGRVKMRLAIREQLTPEQRTQFILMEDRLGKGTRGGRGFRGDGPGHRGDGMGHPGDGLGRGRGPAARESD